jgi:hypothetical protein
MDYEVNLSSCLNVFRCRSPRQDLVLLFASSVRSGRDGSVGIASGSGLDDRRSIPDGTKISLFSAASRPSLGPTRRPIQEELRAFWGEGEG